MSEKRSVVDQLIEFFEEHKDVEISFQSKRNFTDPKSLSEYIRDLEGAVRFYSKESLDEALFDYRNQKSKKKK